MVHLKRARVALGEAHSTDRVWAISEGESLQNMGWLVFMGWIISQANEWEDYSNYFGEGVEVSRNWATSHSLVFRVGPRTVMAPVGVSFSMLMYYNECIMKLTIYWKSNLPPSWT